MDDKAAWHSAPHQLLTAWAGLWHTDPGAQQLERELSPWEQAGCRLRSLSEVRAVVSAAPEGDAAQPLCAVSLSCYRLRDGGSGTFTQSWFLVC